MPAGRRLAPCCDRHSPDSRQQGNYGAAVGSDDLRVAGHRASDNRFWRLCSTQRLWSVHAKKRGLNRKAGPPVHDDLLAKVDHHGRTTHRFTAEAPNTVWLTDISEHPTVEGKLYLCAVKDLHSNKIVGYSIDWRMKSSLAVAALRHAISLRDPVDTIVHSDRGSQFRSRKYVNALNNAGLRLLGRWVPALSLAELSVLHVS